jgi:sarcosine oxidase subunit alpha
LTDPIQANALWAVNMQKPFFIGQRSLKILERRPPRQVLAGIEVLDAERVPKESHLIVADGAIRGRVTSILRSQTLGRTIGLAMLAPELAVPGTALTIRIEAGATLAARVVPTPFYDPKNSRQKAQATPALSSLGLAVSP